MNALFKRQWKEMRESKWIIVPLLFLLFVLNACSSYKNIDCNYNYNIREEEKKMDTLSPDFKWETEKKVNNDIIVYERVSTSNEKGFTKYIQKDTLEIIMNTFIEYDLKGNIKKVYSSIPYIPVGRKFIFDDQGNIKEVINHNEGWNICAFQALFIAKRYAGRNYHKEDPLWQLYRKEYKGKKVWIINYKNRRYKWVNLYIDKDNGRILKVKRR